jgi:hypothetical protein
VLPQGPHGPRGQAYRAGRACGLGRVDLPVVAGPPHPQRALLKLQVPPLEAQELSLTHPRGDGQDVEGLEPLPLREAGTTKLKKGEYGEWLRTVDTSTQLLWNVEVNETFNKES